MSPALSFFSWSTLKTDVQAWRSVRVCVFRRAQHGTAWRMAHLELLLVFADQVQRVLDAALWNEGVHVCVCVCVWHAFRLVRKQLSHKSYSHLSQPHPSPP